MSECLRGRPLYKASEQASKQSINRSIDRSIETILGQSTTLGRLLPRSLAIAKHLRIIHHTYSRLDYIHTSSTMR